jgi:predicted component of type VI protein secretion system
MKDNRNKGGSMAAPTYQITMRSGPEPGKTFPLEQEEVFMGRDLANDITVSDPEVSRRHARFIMQEENFLVEDLGSTNGTFLNGERISTPQQLRPGDVITLGENIIMVFEQAQYDPDVTMVTSSAAQPPQPEPQQPDQPSYQQPEEPAPDQQPQPVVPPTPEKKRKGFPTWLIIMIIAIVVIACVIAVTLYFMPASWWCAITFDMLEGCPIQ